MALPKINSNAVAVPKRPSEDLQAKLEHDGHVDSREAETLVRGWGAKAVTADEVRELRNAVLGQTHSIQAGDARETLQRFLEKKQAANDPSGPRDFWGDLQLKALGDGRISKKDAHQLVDQWSARPLTETEAQQLTQMLLSSTGTFESNEAIEVVQRFLQDKLPKLVVTDKGTLPRDFNTELRIALMNDGHLDSWDVNRLVDRWKKQVFTPTQAKELTEAVLRNGAAIDPGFPKRDMQHFLERDLPRATGPNPDGTPARRDHALDVRIKMLGDGKVDQREATVLTKAWDDPTTTPAEAEAIRQAVGGATLDRNANKELATFIDRNLPKLILGQALTSPNNAKLAWTPPFANVDGTPLTNLAGYTVKYGRQQGVWDSQVQVDDPAAAGFTVENLTPGTWYFVVTARNTEGAESGPSNEASKTVR